jgi:hypothetical protein
MNRVKGKEMNHQDAKELGKGSVLNSFDLVDALMLLGL